MREYTTESGTANKSEDTCPCCGDPMDAGMIVCWVCWRGTDRLTPGTYEIEGETVTITEEMAQRWRARGLAAWRARS